MGISGGLTNWGFCRLGGLYFKNRRMLYCAELNSLQHYGSWNLFHSGDNRYEFGAILDDLPIKINVLSHIHICVTTNWTDTIIWHIYYNHNNANNNKEKMLKL